MLPQEKGKLNLGERLEKGKLEGIKKLHVDDSEEKLYYWRKQGRPSVRYGKTTKGSR